MTIFKRAARLVGLVIFLATVSGYAQPADVASSNVVSAAVSSNAVAQAVPVREEVADRVAKLGDPAPPITILEWIKGRPVKIQPGTNVYVLVFCSLSRANEFALTNLSSLQDEYRDKGVTVVAICNESPDILKEFVMLKGEHVNFTVAADDLPARTSQNYMHAFRQLQLPHAFIVGKDATVLWHGHPLTDGMGQVVADIVAGKFNPAQEQKKVTAREQMDQYLILARMDDPRNKRVGRMLYGVRSHDAAGLVDLAFKIATDNAIDDDKRDVELATAALNRAERLSTTNTADILVTRATLLFQTGKQEEGLKQARQSMEAAQAQDVKDELKACIRAMEIRMEMAKTNQVAGVTGTNQVNAPTPVAH